MMQRENFDRMQESQHKLEQSTADIQLSLGDGPGALQPRDEAGFSNALTDLTSDIEDFDD